MPRKQNSQETFIIRDKCRRCSYCIQICPAKAIKYEKDELKIITERCVLCGNCIEACPHGALVYKSGFHHVRDYLATGQKIVACLDAAFPVAASEQSPRQLVTALKGVGFTEVWEGSFGVELVAGAYRALLTLEGLDREHATHGEVDRLLISSFCPVIVFYIQKYYPGLIQNLVPLVSPMIAMGKVARELKDPDWKVVYISPCFGHMGEIMGREVAGAIDQVISFSDMKQILADAGVDGRQLPETEFDGPRPHLGRAVSVIGGLSRSMGVNFDVLVDDVSVTYGRKRAIGALNQLAAGEIRARFLDLQYCDGCVDGPFVESELSGVSRRQVIARYTELETNKQNPVEVVREILAFKDVNLRRTFSSMEQKLPVPTEEEIRTILKKIDKLPPHHNLDCRACGYPTCREKAIAVAQGMTEAEYCLPYLLEESRKIYQDLEKSHRELQISHEQLEHAQAQLIRTEKLAALGQLAAGVAHEINNPLGTITIYAHILLKGLEANDPRREDLELIVSEAGRTKEIVKGLLSFARETELRPGPTDVNQLLEDVLPLVVNQSLFHNIKIKKSFFPNLPTIHADETQLKQVFLNIILNAAQAMEGSGRLMITTAPDRKQIKVKIRDTGPGISPEAMQKLFNPFFTTKQKGTGLGLAISYGIIERHSGKIDVKTELGKGTTFIVTLPIMTELKGETDGARAGNVLARQNTLLGRKNYG